MSVPFKNYVCLRADPGAPFQAAHCPACGQASVVVDDGEASVTPCGHLAFLYLSESGAFEYLSEAFGGRIRAAAGDLPVSIDELPELLGRLGCGEEFMAIEVEQAGLAHGPVKRYYVYGFSWPAG